MSSVGDLHLVITDIAIPSSTKLRETLEALINSSRKLNTLILEVSLTSHELLSDLDLGQDHDISWYYTLSPSEISCPPTLPQHVTPVSIAFTRAREWQIAAHVLRAYHSTPDTFSDLSTFNLKDLTLLQNKEVFRILVTDFSGVSTRTLWYVVKMLCHVVETTTQRMTDIQENFGKYLDVYTQNVGLMMANQVEQVIRMFSGEFDPSQMFAVFLKCATQWVSHEFNNNYRAAAAFLFDHNYDQIIINIEPTLILIWYKISMIIYCFTVGAYHFSLSDNLCVSIAHNRVAECERYKLWQ